MSVWLTPDLKPFVGGTYFPPNDGRGRPSFRRMLESIVSGWKNERDNIVKLNAALGPSHQLVNVSKDQDWDINYGIRTVVPDQSGVTPMLKIDDLALDQCDLIMLDVESYELKALKGAVETLEKFGPVVFAEQHPGCDSCEPFLRAFGYSVIDYSFHDLIFKK